MQDVEEFGRVFGQPVVQLNVAERGRGSAVANDRPLAVLLAVAEPLRQHPLAGNLVLPNRDGNIINVAAPDGKPVLGFIIPDFVGDGIGVAGNGAAFRDAGRFFL